ncbi:MAG: hypothetical protein GWM90_34195, partial [Gemmatimonadetes bacterium]|nr:hypothetical protein [Gemmatimonadota bacterium]NIQ60413.1 hypothetical protein [Gemmatimonadota bacterium]NIU80624.1 hypothetical protein [Gammaproteobacteria bacterium]NIX48923.1 hypothetical protein [Gemmatimonadota bacterium]NIY13371.1 hypothetical protein [Gemmatimonadota bacterium]
WYAGQVRDLTRPCPPGVEASDHPGRIVCQRPFRPERLPAPLRRLGWTDAEPPRDSILGLSDEEIAGIAAGWLVTSRPVTLRAGRLRTSIPRGTLLSPADSFAAAILRSTLGERPIHFMPGSSHVETLGLGDHVVRHGLTWRIDEDPGREPGRVVRVPGADAAPMLGGAIDLPATDTLLEEVFVRRGRLLDADAPWVDHANTTVPLQYVFAHYAAAAAHTRLGDAAAARRHARRGAWWEDVITPG